jgi:hypothetical protein
VGVVYWAFVMLKHGSHTFFGVVYILLHWSHLVGVTMVVNVFSLDHGIGAMFGVVPFILIRMFGSHSGVPHGYVL